jgi:hypothetical protein
VFTPASSSRLRRMSLEKVRAAVEVKRLVHLFVFGW